MTISHKCINIQGANKQVQVARPVRPATSAILGELATLATLVNLAVPAALACIANLKRSRMEVLGRSGTGQVLSGTIRHAQERSKALYFIHNSTVFKSPNSPVSPKSPVGPMETTPGLFTYEVMGAKSKNLGFAQSRCSCKAQTKDSAMVHGLSAATQQMRRKRTQLAAICIQNKEEEYGQYFSVRPCSNRRSYGCKEQKPWSTHNPPIYKAQVRDSTRLYSPNTATK